ncbi:hypothetical protein SAMN05444008_1304 [Cnuella takakiae]|uniref:Restriction endonuclease n=1 Tax=Cnuella takakiae TaxID=1302690 RepID=A0A1M5JC92_9BACT|nr:restriction endonuclease [Cnuella takakiae]OLY95604.1 restriction endonuclease [Cnuella takakiae]SHG37603.1 hypothetical protein SAMN05444008_1304 [Cnuella takakiae]
MEHSFTTTIRTVLEKHFGEYAEDIFEKSQIIQYINEKTRSASKGSKSRSSFANLYAIYVIVEDYINKGFNVSGNYSEYEGAPFTQLFTRQRQLPFGGKLQNHALNNRMNSEFQKFFPSSEYQPILRNLQTNRYWFNENLLKVKSGKEAFNLAASIIEIIDEYVQTKQDAFQLFIKSCEELRQIENSNPEKVIEFISGLLAPNVDARLFEIVSYSILKFYYHDQVIFWGFEIDNLNRDNLQLYKTGRTNANDGGIDFVMKPLGRFFQVTETLDFKKYFLDIDKIQKFPITFVIKSSEAVDSIKRKIKANAKKSYSIDAIVNRYMDCIEEVINIAELDTRFRTAIEQGYLNNILDEIILQSKVEFNYQDEDEEEESEEENNTMTLF